LAEDEAEFKYLALQKHQEGQHLSVKVGESGKLIDEANKFILAQKRLIHLQS